MLLWGSRGIRYTVTHTKWQKSRGGAVLWNRLSSEAQKSHGDMFLAHYYACKFGWNRLRIDGDIQQKPL